MSPDSPTAVPDPEHPLFAGLAGAEVIHLAFTRGLAGAHAVELTLGPRDGRRERTFRFEGVPSLRLTDRFPEVGWLEVQDVSARQLDGLAVRVADGEQSEALEFWAAAVAEVGRDVTGAPAS